MPDLIWSVKRDVTLKQPAKLIEMIPGLPGKLHAGLDLLGQDPRENDAFFEGLMNLHRPVLKLRRLKIRQDAQESGAMPLAPEERPASPAQRLARVPAHPWLARDELDAAGFEDTLPGMQGELTPQEEEAVAGRAGESNAALGMSRTAPATSARETATPPDAGTVPTQPDAGQILSGLRAGCWVDLYSRRRWLRAQLIWASSKGTLFMFVSHGGQPHSMTQRSCERLIRERLLRPVEMHGVVAQALDHLVKAAAPART